jgi:branched-chain amino acid transport system ATP-binding protein
MPLIHLSRVRRQFGGVVAVNDVDLEIERGEIRGLIGPNGSGKTTLLNVMSGSLRPSGGSIRWKGEEVTHRGQYRRARSGIVRTFQLPTLFSEMTCLEHVMLGSRAYDKRGIVREVMGFRSARRHVEAMRSKALELLDLMGILDTKDELAASLPLGHQRWLAIATALTIQPELLMLDEPLGGMNPVEKSDTMTRIRSLRDSGLTVLLVEHDMRAVMSACERITVMNAGAKIAEGPAKEIRADQRVIDAYLGSEDADA